MVVKIRIWTEVDMVYFNCLKRMRKTTKKSVRINSNLAGSVAKPTCSANGILVSGCLGLKGLT